ncbi:redoxin domain-containing protein [Acetobacteraceae bacterium]|nr:redoxin domain-containing protein [Acetobacteraceae bacterium]
MKTASSFGSFFGRLLPLTGMLLLAVILWMILGALKNGHYDPRAVAATSPLRTVPNFEALPLSTDKKLFNSQDLKNEKKPVLVVFFSSWCVPCIAEMPNLKKLENNIALWGIDYTDSPAKGRKFVEKSGISFERLNQDPEGEIGATWGITGVPESFLIMPNGKIAWHANGPLDLEDFQLHILPTIQNQKEVQGSSLVPNKTASFPAP